MAATRASVLRVSSTSTAVRQVLPFESVDSTTPSGRWSGRPPSPSDGVWWVELASLSDPNLVPLTVMAALGMGDTRGQDPVDRLVGYLASHRVLLVVDNCEHVLDSAAGLMAALLRACPRLTALATSREPLGTGGEVAWRVPPLSLPAEEDRSVEALLGSEAARLFLDRAAEARPSFRLDEGSVATVAAICTRLDGIPLAIELAAARVRALNPDRILDGLSDRFRLLSGGDRAAMPRQQTLQASVEWSHDLLTDSERVLFRRLAAFSGGFRLEAAEVVCAGDPLESWEVLTLLSDLVDKSLVVFDGDRYRLLQTVHDFARSQLVASGEAEAIRDQHLSYFPTMAESASAQLERGLHTEMVRALDVSSQAGTRDRGGVGDPARCHPRDGLRDASPAAVRPNRRLGAADLGHRGAARDGGLLLPGLDCRRPTPRPRLPTIRSAGGLRRHRRLRDRHPDAALDASADRLRGVGRPAAAFPGLRLVVAARPRP